MRLAFVLLLLVAGCVSNQEQIAPEALEGVENESATEQTHEEVVEQEQPVTENETAEEIIVETATYTVLADDNAFYNTDGETITSITIAQGTKTKIKFNTTEDVYYGGLDFRSSIFNSPKVKESSTWTSPEFTMGDTFTVTSYWPASNVKKADLRVTNS